MKTLTLNLLLFLSATLSAKDVPVNSKVLNEINGVITSSDSTPPITPVKGDTINVKKPLVIVDGVEVDYDSIKSCNSDSFEMMTIMKIEDAIAQYGEKGKKGVIILTSKSAGKTLPVTDKKEDELILTVPDVMPEFPGGEKALWYYIASHLRYPYEAAEQGIQGRVFVVFVINTNGKIERIKIVRGVHPILNAEAIRVVSQMPDWAPATKDGKAVNVSYTIPMAFYLQN